MFNPELTNAIEKFASLMINVPDTDLDLPWHWKGHDEGVRFAFFVTLVELRQLAVKLTTLRSTTIKSSPRTPAQYILAQYHSAFMDLQASLAGLSPEQVTKAPDKKGWPVRTIVAHMLGGDIGFSAVIRYALENHRSGTRYPTQSRKKSTHDFMN